MFLSSDGQRYVFEHVGHPVDRNMGRLYLHIAVHVSALCFAA